MPSGDLSQSDHSSGARSDGRAGALCDGATPADHALAASVAWETGELLVRLRGQLVAQGVETTTLKDEGDRQAHELILSLLADRVAAGDGLLSEEGKDGAARLGAERVWI